MPKPEFNRDYPAKGNNGEDVPRAFFLRLPKDMSTPRPVFVTLVGTVESTQAQLDNTGNGETGKMVDEGFVVIAPLRVCVNQNPTTSGMGTCDNPATAKDGFSWPPWNEGRAAGAAGEKWKTVEGADSLYFESVVKCVGKHYKLDPSRFYIGGVSSGGTMTYRALTFRSDFWAGGLAMSGEWYVADDSGARLSFEQGVEAVMSAPTKIHQGACCPSPLKESLSPMVVVSVWGGPTDTWSCMGMPCANYRPSTQAASNYFSSLSNVVHIACSGTHGHSWLRGFPGGAHMFNKWALTTMAAMPKGMVPKDFKLPSEPPPPMKCTVGVYTDHYP
jgi:poly(3-hydroxybutyrate) depolymerase